MKKSKKNQDIFNAGEFDAQNVEQNDINTLEETPVVADEPKNEYGAFSDDTANTEEKVSEDFAAVDKKKKKTAGKKKESSADKTSKAMTALSIALHILSFAVIIGMTLVLAIKSYNLVPYYSFWPFIGVVVVGVFALIFMTVTLVVTRKKTKKDIRRQTVSIVICFFCLTGFFGVLMNVVFPDVIAMATQGTLLTEDLYYNAENQAEHNAGLVRQFIRYNMLNGNYSPDFAYYELSKNYKENDVIVGYENDYIQQRYDDYMSKDTATFNYNVSILSGLEKEMFDFVYNSYILADYDYAFNMQWDGDIPDVQKRQSFALAICDAVMPTYKQLCKEGFKNERIEYLFKNNYNSMDQDGYVAFDDPLLLYAQMDGRMTVPVIVRLILDNKYTYTTPIYDENGNITGFDGHLFEIYDKAAYEWYEENDGTWAEDTVIINDKDSKYYGTILFKNNGLSSESEKPSFIVKKAMKWCVLDMLGDNMVVVEGMNLNDLIPQYGGIINGLLGQFPQLVSSIGDLLKNGVGSIILEAANGCKLTLGLYMDDTGGLGIAIVPGNVEAGVLGYMQMTWTESNNLLFAVINLISVRNFLFICGGIGLVMIIAAGLCREYAKKSREEAAKKLEDGDSGDGGDLPAGGPDIQAV